MAPPDVAACTPPPLAAVQPCRSYITPCCGMLEDGELAKEAVSAQQSGASARTEMIRSPRADLQHATILRGPRDWRTLARVNSRG